MANQLISASKAKNIVVHFGNNDLEWERRKSRVRARPQPQLRQIEGDRDSTRYNFSDGSGDAGSTSSCEESGSSDSASGPDSPEDSDFNVVTDGEATCEASRPPRTKAPKADRPQSSKRPKSDVSGENRFSLFQILF